MNTYAKFCPNVFVAKCPEMHQRGDVIEVTTKYGKENECVVHNLVHKDSEHYYYSITRADGMNSQERARKKADRYDGAATNSMKKSNEAYKASQEGKDFLVLAEPIKIGHHSEKRHRALIERNHNRMKKSVEMERKAQSQSERAEYWEKMADKIDLSMPESIGYFEYELEKAKMRQEGLKNGTIPRDHSFSLPYATKKVKEMQKQLDLARKLWEPN